jgi:hypothetical protein
MHRINVRGFACGVLFLFLVPIISQAAVRYAVTDLGALPDHGASEAWGMNSSAASIVGRGVRRHLQPRLHLD